MREGNDILRHSFGSIAERYDRFRPGPPDEAVELVGMAGTYDAVITMDTVERREYLASIARFLEPHDIPGFEGAFEVPMRCICWRTSLR